MRASFPIGRVVARPKAIVQARRAHQSLRLAACSIDGVLSFDLVQVLD